MKRSRIFFVRILPFLVFSIWIYELYLSYYGLCSPCWFYRVFGFSLITIIPLWIISECDNKYHCIYMRLSYGCVSISECISLLDEQFRLFSSVDNLIYCLVVISILTLLALLYFSVRHFIHVMRIKHK